MEMESVGQIKKEQRPRLTKGFAVGGGGGSGDGKGGTGLKNDSKVSGLSY